MSASILPSVPPTTPSRANDQGGPFGGSGKSVVEQPTPVRSTPLAPFVRRDLLRNPWVKDTPIDDQFFEHHVQPAPPTAFDESTQKKINADVQAIMVVEDVEKPIYAPLASLLTTMSIALYKTLSNREKTVLRKRNRVLRGRPGYLTFIDHHAAPPTQFPNHALTNGATVIDKPDLIAVYNFSDFEHKLDATDGYATHQRYSGVPHSRVEGIVEAKPEGQKQGSGREQLITYAYRHHQARPDHPGLLGLTAGPKAYQVVFSDPTGVVASREIEWTDLRLLAAYVYSHYCPPLGHFLWDDTICWAVGKTVSSLPTWNVQVRGFRHKKAKLVYLGDPWSRRTTVLLIEEKGIILKEMYRQEGRYQEEAILGKIHRDGDVPGVVRMQRFEEVTSRGKVIKCTGNQLERTKVRFALLDSGVNLFQANSVNDVLKTIYDALEAHRAMYNERRIMHRDMSFYNILMYPKLGHSGCPVSNKVQVFIEDLLRGSKPTKPTSPHCLVIDFDNAADLDRTDGAGRLLRERTGTPLFIARSVSLRTTLHANGTFTGAQMPLLQGDALDLYLALHGDTRYNLYNDQPMTDGQRGTFHGGLPPTTAPAEFDTELLPAFSHRPEHDVESIYWTMVYTLLYASPDGVATESKVSTDSRVVWDILLSHHIPEERNPRLERRGEILGSSKKQWNALFCDKMADVAVLLYEISRHVCSEYALWTWTARHQQDHLHEAVQRLIFQYLVNHREKGQEIPLKPNVLRPTPKPTLPELEEAPSDTAPLWYLSSKLVPDTGIKGLKGTRRPTTTKSQNQPIKPASTLSKRKIDDLQRSSEQVRSIKRRKISDDTGHGGDTGVNLNAIGRDQPGGDVVVSESKDASVDETTRAAANIGNGAAIAAAATTTIDSPKQSSVPARTTRSSAKRKGNNVHKPSAGVRSSQRIKDAAAKKRGV